MGQPHASKSKSQEGSPSSRTLEDAAEAGLLVISTARDPDSLNPILTRTEEGRYLTELIFDGLVNLDSVSGDGAPNYERGLLDSYSEAGPEERDDVILVLRKGVLWHDGTPLTSDDVVYTWRALHDSESPIVGWLDYFVADLRKVDDQRLRLLLKVEASEEALNELLSAFKILHKSYTVRGGETQALPTDLRTSSSGVVTEFSYAPIGTGPFKVVDRRPKRLRLERHTAGIEGSAPKLAQIEIEQVDAYGLRVKALKDGAVGMSLDIASGEPELGQADVKPIARDSYSFYAIAYNASAAPFNSESFRKAVNSATDKRRLFTAYTGIGTRDTENINTSIFPNNFEFLQESRRTDTKRFAEANGFDPSAARQRLQLGRVRRFTLLISQEALGPRARDFADEYVRMMKDVGVEVEVKDENLGTFDAYIQDRTYQAVLLYFTGFDHLYDFRELFAVDDKRNPFAVHDPQLERALADYGSTLHRLDLLKLSEQIHNRVEALAPGCFLFSVPRQAFVNNRYSNVALHPYVGFATAEKWVVE